MASSIGCQSNSACMAFVSSDLIGSFAFGQVGWTDGLSGNEWIFQRDNFGSDMTTAALGLLENVVGHKSSHHVGMRRNQDLADQRL